MVACHCLRLALAASQIYLLLDSARTRSTTILNAWTKAIPKQNKKPGGHFPSLIFNVMVSRNSLIYQPRSLQIIVVLYPYTVQIVNKTGGIMPVWRFRENFPKLQLFTGLANGQWYANSLNVHKFYTCNGTSKLGYSWKYPGILGLTVHAMSYTPLESPDSQDSGIARFSMDFTRKMREIGIHLNPLMNFTFSHANFKVTLGVSSWLYIL